MHFIIGVGGPTSSGKTTLAKHLASILSDSSESPSAPLIIHQDDFAPPEDFLPWNEQVNGRDWDHPDSAIDYPRMLSHLEHIRQNSTLPSNFSSHDSSNLQPSVPISSNLTLKWSSKFNRLLNSSKAKELDLKIDIADGFLLYYDSKVRSHIDCRLFLRIDKDLLKERRENRGGYNTAEGVLWQDPPGYFDQILWPSYLLAHESFFESKDVNGTPISIPKSPPLNFQDLSKTKREGEGENGGQVPGLIVLEAQEKDKKPRDMNLLVEEACIEIEKSLNQLVLSN